MPAWTASQLETLKGMLLGRACPRSNALGTDHDCPSEFVGNCEGCLLAAVTDEQRARDAIGYRVQLVAYDRDYKVRTIAALRNNVGIDLQSAVAAIDRLPIFICRDRSYSEAEALAATFRDVFATVAIEEEC